MTQTIVSFKHPFSMLTNTAYSAFASYLFAFFVGCIAFSNSLQAQTYINPPFKGKSTSLVDIEKVEFVGKYTIVHMKVVAPESYIFGGWACITRSTYIEDVKRGKRYRLIKVKGIPVCPEKYMFTRPGQVLRFRLYFPKLKYNVNHIHIIEDLYDVQNPFNFFNVYLRPLA